MYDDSSGAFGLALFFLLFLPIILIFAALGYVLSSFFLMKIFDKAGVQGRWRAWVPVYNILVFAKLGDFSPWVMLGVILASGILGQIPVLGFVFALLPLAASVMVGLRVGTKLNKEWYWMLLWLIGIGYYIWLGVLAFSKDRWNANIPPAPWANSFLADKTVWEGVPAQQGGAYPPAGYAAPAPGAYPPPAAGAYPPPAGYTAPPASDVPPAPPVPPAPEDPNAPRV